MDAGVIKPHSQGFFHFKGKSSGNEVGCHPQPQEQEQLYASVRGHDEFCRL